jgi:YesN/AraC family two-component response regulator
MMVDYAKVFSLTKQLTLLFIEDDINFQQETKEILKDLFYHVDTALDGEEGLKKYLDFYDKNSKPYDIIVTDINMPKLNGIKLIKKIYAKNKKQPIIVLSAHNESKYLRELINIGIEQFLIKPFDYNQILELFYNVSNKILTVKTDSQIGKEFSKHGREFVETYFNRRKLAEDLEKIILEVMKN